jgi:hypothetical protein
MMTRRLREIFLVEWQKQAFSFNKSEAKVYCYAFLHVLKRDTCIKHEKNKKRLQVAVFLYTFPEYVPIVCLFEGLSEESGCHTWTPLCRLPNES